MNSIFSGVFPISNEPKNLRYVGMSVAFRVPSFVKCLPMISSLV